MVCRQYGHPAADFEMNAPNGDKQTLLTLDISSVSLAINLISKLS
jgi:hypothetical protein